MPVLAGFHHVKLPVRDVARSRDWYQQVLGLQPTLDFVEEGRLMGVAMQDAAGTVQVALRVDPARAAALAEFDPLAVAVATREELELWRQHLDALPASHDGIMTGHTGSVLVGLRDPDGIEVRLYTDTPPAPDTRSGALHPQGRPGSSTPA